MRFDIETFVQAPYDKLVRRGTRFWDAGAVHLAMGGSGPSVQLQSVPALLKGAIAFEIPSSAAREAESHDGDSFTLYPDRETALNAPDPRSVAYTVDFPGEASGLGAGAAVKLIDMRVGTVTDSTLEYDLRTGQLSTRATIMIEPTHLHLTDAGQQQQQETPPRAAMDAAIGAMIGNGLRAQLASSTPVIGGPVVTLRFVPGARAATLIPGSPPEIPSVPGSSIDRIVSEASDVMAKVDAMPLPQIADDLHRTTERIAQIANSKQLAESLRNLDRSLANVTQMTAQARRQVAPILAEVHKAADQAQATLASARSLLGSGGAAQNSVQSAGVPATLYELARAARSLRELSDYLDRHPEALLQGKAGSG